MFKNYDIRIYNYDFYKLIIGRIAPKSNYLSTIYTKEPLKIEQIKEIHRYNKSRLTNFFFHTKAIKEIVNILTPEISHMELKQKNELYSNMERRLYEFLY